MLMFLAGLKTHQVIFLAMGGIKIWPFFLKQSDAVVKKKFSISVLQWHVFSHKLNNPLNYLKFNFILEGLNSEFHRRILVLEHKHSLKVVLHLHLSFDFLQSGSFAENIASILGTQSSASATTTTATAALSATSRLLQRQQQRTTSSPK